MTGKISAGAHQAFGLIECFAEQDVVWKAKYAANTSLFQLSAYFLDSFVPASGQRRVSTAPVISGRLPAIGILNLYDLDVFPFVTVIYVQSAFVGRRYFPADHTSLTHCLYLGFSVFVILEKILIPVSHRSSSGAGFRNGANRSNGTRFSGRTPHIRAANSTSSL